MISRVCSQAEAWARREHGVRVSYVPVDTSQALLEMACGGALRARFPAQGIKADVTRPDHLAALAPEPETPRRLVLLIGNTLGAFDPLAAARELAGLLRRGDRLLVDGEIYAGDATVAGYDNPLNRRFAWAPLHAVGIRDADGDLVFEAKDDPRLPGLHFIPKHFSARRDLEAQTGGEALPLARGERLDMSHSYKYAAETFLRILADAGLVARWQGPSLEGWPPERIAARVRELLALVGLDPAGFARRYPHELSGGQRQRVGVARALAADPPLLLLDEPFGAVDPITRVELQREFQTLKGRLAKGMVFVTHDVREGLRLGTRIGLMHEGRLAFLRTPEEFRASGHPEVRKFLEAA